MSYQVLARKWRPQTFGEVVGQETVTRTLQNAIKAERIAHAFLFSGVRGVGKTTTARILAKALNCQQGPTPSPCGECDSCREIPAAGSVDVLEIDAASNTGVDNIRDLRESVRYGTARDRFKIFIIDEVHMLSNQAFNALLKTLEEPPPHVKFILATTELNKIPATIASRCQQFNFKPIPFFLILERLQEICREEEIQISEYALRAVVSQAEGSLRDAQSVLDQIRAFSGKQIDDEDVRLLLGVVDERAPRDLLEAVSQRDGRAVIEGVEALRESGVEPLTFCGKLIQHLRNLMVCKVAGWDPRLLDLPDSDREALMHQCGVFSELDLIRLYDALMRCEGELRWHAHPYVHLEITLMKLLELARLPAVEEIISRLESGERPAGGDPVEEKHAASPGLFDREAKSAGRPVEGHESPSRDPGSVPPEPSRPLDSSPVTRLLADIQQQGPALYHSIQQAAEVRFERNKLSIVFPASEAVHREMILRPENHDRLSRLCARLTGSTPEIEVRILDSEEEQTDPVKDPQVQTFIKSFPGKVIVERKGEDS